MRSGHKIAFAGILGATFGAVAMSALHAQTATPPAYWIANIQEVKDETTYDMYRSRVNSTLAPFGGRFIVRGAEPMILDQSPKPPGYIVVLEFPSMKNLQDWWNSPDYSGIRPIRERVTVGQGYAVQGVPPT